MVATEKPKRRRNAFMRIDRTVPLGNKIADITGRVFESLTVTGYAGRYEHISEAAVWDVRCVCGRTDIASGTGLLTGRKRCCRKCGRAKRKPQKPPPPKRYDLYGERLTIADLAQVTGLAESTVRSYLGQGMPLEELMRRKPKRPLLEQTLKDEAGAY